VAVMVNVIEDPSSTVVVDSDIDTVGTTSLTLTDALVATTGPEVEPVLIVSANDSVPSVAKSFAIVLVTVATPVVAPVPTIVNDPVRELSEKSDDPILEAVL